MCKFTAHSCLRSRADTLKAEVCLSCLCLSLRLFKSISMIQEGRLPRQALLKVSMASPSSSTEIIWGHAHWDWAAHRCQHCCFYLFLWTLEVALIGCLAQPVSGLFPDGGTVAALVEQHIGLIGLKLVLWDWSNTVVGKMEINHEKQFQVYISKR